MVHFSVFIHPVRPAVRLTLLVPELIWPEPADRSTLADLPPPGFARLAARAAFARRPALPFEAALADLFGLPAAAFGPLRLLGEFAHAGGGGLAGGGDASGNTDGMGLVSKPEADDAAAGNPGRAMPGNRLAQAVAKASAENGEATGNDGYWLCADPVHLRFHHERIVLADAGAFDLEDDEAQRLVADLNREFADIGHFRAATARRWYLRLAAPVEHAAAPLSAVAGRRVDGSLSGRESALTRWLNEVQMFLHGHPVNASRQAAGKPAVNSLWLWGAGRLPTDGRSGFSRVWADHPLALGMALASGTPAAALPAGLTAALGAGQPADPGEHALIVLDTLLPPVLYEDGEAWRHAWQALEDGWFAPLRKALGQGARVDIVAPTVYGLLSWTLRPRDRWRFWRRPTTLAELAGRLAEERAT